MEYNTRIKIAFVKTESELLNYKDEDLVDWDSLSEKEQEEMRIKLNIQYLESLGAKNIRIKEKIV